DPGGQEPNLLGLGPNLFGLQSDPLDLTGDQVGLGRDQLTKLSLNRIGHKQIVPQRLSQVRRTRRQTQVNSYSKSATPASKTNSPKSMPRSVGNPQPPNWECRRSDRSQEGRRAYEIKFREAGVGMRADLLHR